MSPSWSLQQRVRPEVTEPGIHPARLPALDVRVVSQGVLTAGLCTADSFWALMPLPVGNMEPAPPGSSLFRPGERSSHPPGRPARGLTITTCAFSLDSHARDCHFRGPCPLNSSHPCRVLLPRCPSWLSLTPRELQLLPACLPPIAFPPSFHAS